LIWTQDGFSCETVVDAMQGRSGGIISRGNLIRSLNANGALRGGIAERGILGGTVANRPLRLESLPVEPDKRF